MCRTAVLAALVLVVALAAPLTADSQDNGPADAIVTSSVTPASPGDSGTRNAKPQVYSLKVRSDIRSRYARTLVTSRIANPADRAQEVTFQVTIPETAFISKFIMEVDGEVMEGAVRERAQAKQEYHHAVQSGQTAGHVATASVRDSSHVRVSVNVAANSKASFNLTYEELLVRRKGRYELAVNLSPGQVVREMSVDVYIQESSNITGLVVPSFRTSNEIDFDQSKSQNQDATVEWVSGHQAHIHFAPSEADQRRLGAGSGSGERGLGGQFLVHYDVVREPGAGEVLAFDGFFVHFFSPPELKPLPKHAVFVLDVSGSMHGRKMEQLREAMDVILRELNPGDFFNLIEFSYSVTVLDLESPSNNTVLQPSDGSPQRWYNPGAPTEEPTRVVALPPQVKAFPATADFITKAREAVRKMSAGGGTNIHDSVRAALGVAKAAVSFDGSAASLPEPIIIFLTDGEATVGETRADRILALLNQQGSEHGVPLFSLAFGQDADFAFLKRLSLRAGAFARKIYEASDAALQLQDFYRQVASPLLANVTFNYSDSQVDGSSLTKKEFGLLFSGTELVVAGKTSIENTDSLLLSVRGVSQDGEFSQVLPRRSSLDEFLPPAGVPPPSATAPPQPGDRFLERLWAYLSIRQQLERYDAERDDDSRGRPEDSSADSAAQVAKAKALQLALKFSFVTPVTSLIVVKSNDTSATVTPSTSVPESAGQGPVSLQFGSADVDTASSVNSAIPQSISYTSLSVASPSAMQSRASANNLHSAYSRKRGRTGTRKTFRTPDPAPATSMDSDQHSLYLMAGGGAGSAGGFSHGGSRYPLLAARPSYSAPAPAYSNFESSAVQESDEEDDGGSTFLSVTSLRGPPGRPIPRTTTIRPWPSTTTTPAAPSYNWTLLDVSALTWLNEVTEDGENNTATWRLVHVGNNSEIYKLLTANQVVNNSTQCASLAGRQRVCQPLAECALADFAESSKRYLDDYVCFLGTDRFLGACCPDSVVLRATTLTPSVTQPEVVTSADETDSAVTTSANESPSTSKAALEKDVPPIEVSQASTVSTSTSASQAA